MTATRTSSGFRVASVAAAAVFAAMMALWAGRPVGSRAEDPKAAAGHADAVRGVIAKYAKSIGGADTTLASTPA
jgi:hypothetical protein